MKNLKRFSVVLSICLLLTVSIGAFVSCSTDSTEPSSESNSSMLARKLNTREIDSLSTVFRSIMNSSEYRLFEADAKLLGKKVKRANITFNNKNDFQSDLSRFITQTDFATVTEGVNLYDRYNLRFYTLYSKYQSFYDRMATVDADDVYLIIQPSFGDPIEPPLITNACGDACMDNFETNTAILDWMYSAGFFMSFSIGPPIGDIHFSNRNPAAYWNQYYNLVDAYSDCYGTCPT